MEVRTDRFGLHCLQRAACRVSVITLLIVMLVTRIQNQWIIAMHGYRNFDRDRCWVGDFRVYGGVQIRRVNGCVNDDIGSSLITVS